MIALSANHESHELNAPNLLRIPQEARDFASLHGWTIPEPRYGSRVQLPGPMGVNAGAVAGWFVVLTPANRTIARLIAEANPGLRWNDTKLVLIETAKEDLK